MRKTIKELVDGLKDKQVVSLCEYGSGRLVVNNGFTLRIVRPFSLINGSEMVLYFSFDEEENTITVTFDDYNRQAGVYYYIHYEPDEQVEYIVHQRTQIDI